MFNFLLWVISPLSFEMNVKSLEEKSIKQKSFAEIETNSLDMYFYKIDSFNFDYSLTRKNWITTRGFCEEDRKTFAYLFNEGDNEFVVKKGMIIGKFYVKKISFIELWKKIWKK